MSGRGTEITLRVEQASAGGKPGWRYRVFVNGETVGQERTVDPRTAVQIRDFGRRYAQLFETKYQPAVKRQTLESLGDDLFQTWFAADWQVITARGATGPRRIVLASDDATILNLPWELTRPANGAVFGADPNVSLRRTPQAVSRLPTAQGGARPGPLHVVFTASAPSDQHWLNYEIEERTLIDVFSSAGDEIVFDGCDLGTLDELGDRVADVRPHIVHLTGHGAVIGGVGRFAFETEEGKTDRTATTTKIVESLAGAGVEAVFVSACQSGQAPATDVVGGICAGLVAAGIPFAIGWAASVDDQIATAFAREWYDRIAHGVDVDHAFRIARRRVREQCEKEDDPSWTLPVLYAATTQEHVLDRTAPWEQPRRRSLRQEALPGMQEGYAESFIGRRREQQRLLAALRRGPTRTVILTGLGGAGKSSLATRLARKLEQERFTPLPIPSPPGEPLSESRLAERFANALYRAGFSADANALENRDVDLGGRLQQLIGLLNSHRFVVLLDNLEVNLGGAQHAFDDPAVGEFYGNLLKNLTGASRLIVTSRYLPATPKVLPASVVHEELGEFPEADCLKFLLRNDQLRDRWRRGDLPTDLLREAWKKLGGAPHFLLQLRQTLATMPTDRVREELARLAEPVGKQPGELERIRDEYCGKLLTAWLVDLLSPEAKRALFRAAVFEIPVPVEGLAAVAGRSADQMRLWTAEWAANALAHPTHGRKLEPWTVYGMLRGWLLKQNAFSAKARRSTCRAAGNYLMGMVEANRVQDLGLPEVDILREARRCYLTARDAGGARATTAAISKLLNVTGGYREIIVLNEEVLSLGDEVGLRLFVAQAHFNLGHYDAARTTLRDALTIQDLPSWTRAYALSALADIDANQGDYPAARARYEESLRIERELDDRRGEAATIAQLGWLARQWRKRDDEAFRLYMVAWLLLAPMGHTQAGTVGNILNQMAADLGYDKDTVERVVQDVEREYASDGGRGMIDEALRDEA